MPSEDIDSWYTIEDQLRTNSLVEANLFWRSRSVWIEQKDVNNTKAAAYTL